MNEPLANDPLANDAAAPDTSYYPGAYAASDPERLAVVMAESGASMTYAELEDHANRLSHLFRSSGLQPGDHVAFCFENRVEFGEIVVRKGLITQISDQFKKVSFCLFVHAEIPSFSRRVLIQ